MNDTCGVRSHQSPGNLDDDIQCLAELQRLLIYYLAKRLPINEFSSDEMCGV